MLQYSAEEDKDLMQSGEGLEAMLKLCMSDFPELDSERLSEKNRDALRIVSLYIKDETKTAHTRCVYIFLCLISSSDLCHC